MSGAAVVMIVAVVLIVLALVYYLVSTILQLRQITAGLDEVIAGVVEIIEKSAPVNANTRAAVRARGSRRSVVTNMIAAPTRPRMGSGMPARWL